MAPVPRRDWCMLVSQFFSAVHYAGINPVTSVLSSVFVLLGQASCTESAECISWINVISLI